ncbi:MAG: hypothetical protein KDA60_00975, partial [Planctomycetales bacterium]|nr:hypothetical protein [Planctomycetales bacterium]
MTKRATPWTQKGDAAVIVTEFQIDRFRNEHPLRVLDLGNGLNVALVGDDDARRKMLDVVPSVLYGSPVFSTSLDDRGSLPAIIAVRTDNGVFRIRREIDDARDSGQRVSIKSPDNVEHELSFLKTLLDGVGKERYRRVYTLNTTRIGRRLKRDRRAVIREVQRLGKYLHDKSPQSSVVSPPEVSTSSLTDVGKSLSALTAALSQQAAKDQSTTDEAPRKLDPKRIAADLAQVENQLTKARQHEELVHRDLEETRHSLTISRLRQQLTAVDKDLAQTRKPPVKSDASRAGRSLTEIDSKLGRCRQRIDELLEEQRGIQQQIDDVQTLSRVRPLLPRIEAVLLQERFLVTEEQAIELLADHVRNLEARLDSDRRRVQSRSADHEYEQTRASEALGEIDRFLEQLRRTRREYRDARERLTQQQKESANSTTAAASTSSTFTQALNDYAASQRKAPTATGPAAGIANDWAQRVTNLRERMRIDEELAGLQRDRSELEKLMQRLYAEQLVPFRVLMWLGVPFMLGVALVIYGMFIPEQTSWRHVGFGLAFAIGTSLLKLSLDRANGDRLLDTRDQVAEIDRSISQWMSRADALDEQLPHSTRPLPDQLLEAEQMLAEAGPSRPDVAPVQVARIAPASARADQRAWRSRVTDARRRYKEMISRWREFLLELGLSPALSPSQARELLEQRATESLSSDETRDRALEFQLRQLRNDLDRRRAAFAQAITQSRELVQDLGFASTGSTVDEQMDVLRESIQDSREEERACAELAETLQQVKQREIRLTNYLTKLEEERTKTTAIEEERARQHKIQQQLQAEKQRLLERERQQLVERLDALRTQRAEG